MHPILKDLLGKVVSGVFGSFTTFKLTRDTLRGGCNDLQFLHFLSQQYSLHACEPEALIEASLVLSKYDWFLSSPLSLVTETSTESFQPQLFVKSLLTARHFNLGAMAALLEILALNPLPNAIIIIIGHVNSLIVKIIDELYAVSKQADKSKLPYLYYCYGLIYQKNYAQLYSKRSTSLSNYSMHVPAALTNKSLPVYASVQLQDFSNIPDELKAVAFFDKAANDLSVAAYQVGFAYEMGQGVIPNRLKACDHFNKAYKQLNSLALLHLGIICRVEKEYCNLFGHYADHFLKAAVQGNAEAQYYYASWCIKECGRDENITIGRQYLEMAKLQNKAESNIYIGFLFEQGIGVKQDLASACQNYLIAYHQSNGLDAAAGAILFLQYLYELDPSKMALPNHLIFNANVQEQADLMYQFVLWCQDEGYLEHAMKCSSVIIEVFTDCSAAYLFRANINLHKKKYEVVIDDLLALCNILLEDGNLDDEENNFNSTQIKSILYCLNKEVINDKMLQDKLNKLNLLFDQLKDDEDALDNSDLNEEDESSHTLVFPFSFKESNLSLLFNRQITSLHPFGAKSEKINDSDITKSPDSTAPRGSIYEM